MDRVNDVDDSIGGSWSLEGTLPADPPILTYGNTDPIRGMRRTFRANRSRCRSTAAEAQYLETVS